MSGTRYVARATKVAARMIGDEMMIMSGLDSSLFSLNVTASVLWQAADGRTLLADIVDRHICTRFDIGRGVALRDAEEMAEDLARHGILRVSDAPIVDAGTMAKGPG
ncbi:MAG: PqqD family protein [Betaproteobacteria bacterium]